MLSIMLSRDLDGTIVEVASYDAELAKRTANAMIRGSMKIDKCIKIHYRGDTVGGEYAVIFAVKGLDYDFACNRLAELWPGCEVTNPPALIGG